MNGRIKSIKLDRGFGFIECEDGTDRFFHANQCRVKQFSQYAVRDEVTFTPVPGPDAAKGERCNDVTPR